MKDIGLEELRYLCRQYKKLPDGKECVEAIRYAIKRSDELGIREWQLRCRSDLISQFVGRGDEGELLPVLSEFVSIFEEQPMEKYVQDYLYTLYRALGQWRCFSQLPLKEWKKVSDHFLQACKRYHANLFAYYDETYTQCLLEGKTEEAKKYRKKALGTLGKKYAFEVSSCAACKQFTKVEYAIDDKNWEKAVKEAQPLLNGTLKCRQHPKSTVSSLLIFALDIGNWEEAEHYADLLVSFPKEDGEDPLWETIRYYAFADLERGVELFCESFPDILEAYDQIEQKGFYEEAYVLWKQYARKYEKVSLELPKKFPLYREDGEYDPSELAEWFYKKTFEIAKRFDERNGYPYYQNRVDDMIEGMKKMEQRNYEYKQTKNNI